MNRKLLLIPVIAVAIVAVLLISGVLSFGASADITEMPDVEDGADTYAYVQAFGDAYKSPSALDPTGNQMHSWGLIIAGIEGKVSSSLPGWWTLAAFNSHVSQDTKDVKLVFTLTDADGESATMEAFTSYDALLDHPSYLPADQWEPRYDWARYHDSNHDVKAFGGYFAVSEAGTYTLSVECFVKALNGDTWGAPWSQENGSVTVVVP